MDSYDGDLQEVTPIGKSFKMLVDPDYLNSYINGSDEKFTEDLILSHLHNGSIFLDIGARHGYYSILAGYKYPSCKVVAIEASSFFHQILSKNIELNNLKNIELRTDPFDNWFNDIKADSIVRIASDGNEVTVLKGIKNSLGNMKRVELFIEFNPEAIKKSGYQPEYLLDLIEELGFDRYIIEEGSRLTYKLKDSKDWRKFFNLENLQGVYVNLICIHKDRSLSLCIFSHSSQLYGAERGLLEIVSELITDYGVLCTVVLPGDGPLKERLEKAGSSTLVIGYNWWCDLSVYSEEKISQSYDHSYNALRSRMDELEAINPDVIITNTLVIPWGALTALSLNKPHAWYVREFGQLDHGLKFFLPFEEVIKIIGTSNIVLSISNAVRTALFKDALSPSITIYNYINIPADALDKDTVQYFVKKNATRLIITGNISEPKGQKDAVLAVKRLIEKGKDVELVIMGISQPDYLDEVKELIKIYELENHIKCLDFNPNPYPIVSQSDIVLVCSRSEAFGRVIVEGMLIKKPVIGTKSGGIPELIKDGINGLLYEPGKPEQLAEKIEYLIDNVDKKNEIAENGFNYAQRTFTKENYGGEAFKQLFNLKNNGNRSPPILLSLLVSLMSRALNAKDVENKAIILEKEKLEQTIVKNVEIINQLENIIQQKEATILQKEASVQRLRDELSLIKGSIIWRTVTRYQSIVDLFMPHRTLRRKFYDTWLKAMSIVVSNNPVSLYLKIQQRIAPKKYSYEQWIRENEPSKEELAAQKVQSKKFMMRPLISIIVPVYNTPPDVLEKMLKSVIDQTYGNWELCIAVGGSKDNNIRNILSGVDDPRVKTKFLDKNLGISGNTNEALTLAIGEFISFLDHDDELAPFALYEVVRAINEKPDLDIIYSDEDKIDMENNRSSPFFKPDWSLPMFLSTNYMCHFLVCRRSLVDKLEKFRSEFDGAQDYDFALRLIELTTGNRIGHIQKVLYHWRIISSSAASGQHAKPYAYDAGKKALNEYMERNHIDCEAITDQVNWGSYHVIKRSVTHKKLVMVLVGNNSRMSDCLSTILQDTISSQNNGPVAIYAPKSLKMSGYRTYDSLNESIETILGEIGPEYFVFIKDTITTGDIQESHDHKWPCALLEQFDRFRDVGIVGTGSAVYSNVICSAHRPCGPVFCMPSSLLLSYIRGNRLPDDYDTLQIALSDYAELYGHENIYTPYSIGKLNDLSIVPKYYLELFDKRYFTNNMRYYLKGIL